MDITAALAAELSGLTDDLGIPTGDLERGLNQLIRDTERAVTSFLGLSVTLTVGRQEVTLDALKPGVTPDDIGTTLRMPLDLVPSSRGQPGGTAPDPDLLSTTIVVSMYAGTPGAFVDLAADLAWASEHDVANFVVDRDSATGHQTQKMTGVQDLSDINQAIGMLIDRGRSPGEARAELEAAAALEGNSVSVTARALLAELSRQDHRTTE